MAPQPIARGGFSLMSMPLILLALIFYYVVVAIGKLPAEAAGWLNTELFKIPLPSKTTWVFRWSDLIIFVTMFTLFVELLKSTWTTTSSLIDHGLSMLVFIATLLLFILRPEAGTSVFFVILIASLIDVIAGYTIGIRTARRDINFGTDS